MKRYINEDRELWLDIAKFLGILAVFVGHFGKLAGGSYPFVYLYQNALFFFCSGYLHSQRHDDHFAAFMTRKCKHLLIPGIAFSLLVFFVSILFEILTGTVDMEIIKENLTSILLLNGLGLGNWFFTGLFSISVIFEIIDRILIKLKDNSGGGQSYCAAIDMYNFVVCT